MRRAGFKWDVYVSDLTVQKGLESMRPCATRSRKMASRMLDRDYTLTQFTQDRSRPISE